MARHLVCSNNLGKVMARSHMTISRLARITGVKRETIRKYVRGDSDPNVYVALLISEALLCEVHHLWEAEVIETKDL